MATNLFRGAQHASVYAKYRPTTPEIVIHKILNFLKQQDCPPLKALDVGCGSGQSTRILAEHFKEVVGTDVSENQLKEAQLNPENPKNVTFRISPAESCPLEDGSVSVITASQCAHWFNLDQFYKEADRLLKPNGVLAIYGYEIPKFIVDNDPIQCKQLNDLLFEYYESLSPYWEPARRTVDDCYRSITLPYQDQSREEAIRVRKSSSALSYLGYLTSWSGYQSWLKQDKEAAEERFNQFIKQLKEILGKEDLNTTVVDIAIDYFLLLGRKP